MPELRLNLPYPPTVNHYWRHARGRHYISKEGKDYRDGVIWAVKQRKYHQTMTGRLSVSIAVEPPDKRRRDLDNLTKGLLDAMQAAGVYEDDSQIDDLRLFRVKPKKPGSVQVFIQEAE